jgi:hypothetical protein
MAASWYDTPHGAKARLSILRHVLTVADTTGPMTRHGASARH